MPNQIVTENRLAGNPDTEWDITSGSTTIEGFATDISVNHGKTVSFKINTSSSYQINIYRLGYYGGKGARKVASSVAPVAPVTPVTILRNPSPQSAPLTTANTGLIDAGNWSVSATWAVPANAVSGVYVALLIGSLGKNHIPFIVRDDETAHDIVFQTSDTTWHAYNGWHGNSLYGGGGPASDGRAYKVSYNRPIATRDGTGTYAGPQDFLFGVEIAAIRWLESNGYDVCYMAGVDTDRLDTTGAGKQFTLRKVFISCGHDEYWSGNQRKNVEAARSNGKHLAFWSGNEVFWKTRWEPDGNGNPYRTLVCYKETRDFPQHLDPLDPGTVTCSWRDPRFGSDANQPENGLTGTIFQVDDFREDQILIPFPMTKLRFWRHCAIASTPSGGSGKLVKNYLGYEWDESPDNGFRPQGQVHLSLTTLSVNTYLLDYGKAEGPGIATHSLSLYKNQTSGAIVFGAGTVMWSWGLDPNHDPDPDDTAQTPVDPNVKQAMINLLADMGLTAGSPLSGFVYDLPFSTDHTPPTTIISFPPATGGKFNQNQNVTVTGTASDTGGGIVAAVEVSTDGIKWHPANTTTFSPTSGSITGWTYNWTPSVAGPYTISARAVDDSLNIGAAVTASGTIAASTTVSLFNGATPTTISVSDPNSVELGVRFSSTQNGTISAIRFYKGPSNTGAHTAHLWSSTGTLLASANFTAETSSGWQQANFTSPVAITAGSTYVASYHTPGNYSADSNYFTVARTVGPLTAPASGNGAYTYGANPVFPSTTFLASNYYIDVAFNPGAIVTPRPPVANNDTGIVATENTALPIQAGTLLGNDTDPAGLAISLNTVTSGTGGSVAFSGTTVTFTPMANYTGPASFIYTIKNAANLVSTPATVSLTVVAPGTSSSLFSPSNTPATVTVNDTGAVELGVKFTSSVLGKITGIRFYKGPQNLGTHIGNLWTTGGTRLATATFTNETASGWQHVNFTTPVSIQANTTYVVSYYAPRGFYSANSNYFANALVNGTLTAPANAGVAGGNGVYAYSATSKFPNSTVNATNYWVDVVFST